MTAPLIDPHDRARFGLTMISNLMLGERGEDLEERLYRGILRWLADPYGISVLRGRWEVVWGPAIRQFDTDLYAVNSMYVARKVSALPPDHDLADPTDPDEPAAEGKPPQYVIAIAGTNPTSPFDWVVEDFWVSRQVDWLPTPEGDPPARISEGTSIGLNILLDLKPGQGRPGAGLDLDDFLWEHATDHGSREIDLRVCGHSLGGALAPALALWLAEDGGVRDLWDPHRRASIHIMPMAGASPGNDAFAHRVEAAFGGDHTRRYANTLDVVPHAWEPAHLDQIPDLYQPWVRALPSIQLLTDWARRRSRSGDYADVGSARDDFEGAFDWCRYDVAGFGVINFVNQMVFQHIHAYFQHFNVDGGEMLDKIPPLPATLGELVMAVLRALGISATWAPTDAPTPVPRQTPGLPEFPTPPTPSLSAVRSMGGIVASIGLRALRERFGVLRLLPEIGPLAPRSVPSPTDGRPLCIHSADDQAVEQLQTQLTDRQRQRIERSRELISRR